MNAELRSRPVSEARIRPANSGDAEAMATVYVAAAREGWERIFGADNLVSLEPPVERLRTRIAADSAEHVLVVEVDSSIRGYAIVRPSADGDANPERCGELDAIYTDPTVWGQGIGRMLLASAARALAARGFTEATLWTAEGNVRPRRIYADAGWKPDGATRERT